MGDGVYVLVCNAIQESLRVPEVGGTSIAGRTAVIAGASSGIGRATARALATSGARVGIAARRVERLVGLKE